MDLGLRGKRALVLGGTRGLGFGIARALAAEGAAVMLTGRDRTRVDAAVAAAGGGAAVHGHAVTLASADAAKPLVAEAISRLGGIDILINNNGGPPPGPITSVAAETWSRQFEAMVGALIAVAGEVLPEMRARRWGRILTIASSGVEQPIPNLGLSNSLRAALAGWSKTLAAEVAAEGVTVNTLLPGRIQTERLDELDRAAAARTGQSLEEVATAARASIPAGRYGTVAEFAAVATFLVSDPASYVTGSMIRVDGGLIRSI
jgi:3-oxoacyl-[acyl-carrier protein] reductase